MMKNSTLDDWLETLCIILMVVALFAFGDWVIRNK